MNYSKKCWRIPSQFINDHTVPEYIITIWGLPHVDSNFIFKSWWVVFYSGTLEAVVSVDTANHLKYGLNSQQKGVGRTIVIGSISSPFRIDPFPFGFCCGMWQPRRALDLLLLITFFYATQYNRSTWLKYLNNSPTTRLISWKKTTESASIKLRVAGINLIWRWELE